MSRRSLAALLAGVGLGILLAGLSVLAWWFIWNRESTMRVVGEATQLEALLEEAPYITLYSGTRPVTIIAPRSAYGLEGWLMDDAALLAEMGREVRVIMVPSGHGGVGEDATIAELWLERDIGLLGEWFSMRAEHWTGLAIPSPTTSPSRMSALAEARGFRKALMQSLSRNGEDARWPVVVWRDRAGQMAVCLCNTANAVHKARLALGLPTQNAGEDPYDDLSDAFEPTPAPSVTEPQEEDDDEDNQRYPRLADDAQSRDFEPYRPSLNEHREGARTPSPLLPGDVGYGARTPETPPRPRDVAPAPKSQNTAPVPRPRRELNTAPPKAEKDAESLFY